MADRFFAPDLTEAEGSYFLAGNEAHHLRTVCRAKPGTVVELLNGAGLVAEAKVLEVSRQGIDLSIESRRLVPAPPNQLTLAVAIPKGDRAQWLVEKATELGAARLIPLRTERSVVEAGDNKIDKLRRSMIEASKQCGRAWQMEIDTPVPFADLLTQADGLPGSRWLLHPSGPAIGDLPSTECEPRELLAAIGPEGGWTDSEVEQARAAGWQIVRFPGHILRIETAAVAMAAWFQLRPET